MRVATVGQALRHGALFVIFFGLLTPLALALRLLGRDPLRLRPHHDGPIWLPRHSERSRPIGRDYYKKVD